MSKTIISIERVNNVQPHPNADRLDVVQVLGYNVVTGRDEFRVDDAVVYFPPDILIHENVADMLGVKKYLKHAIFPGDNVKTQCRVSAARLRGVPSHGFICGIHKCGLDPIPAAPYGTDITERYGAHKYEPPVKLGSGDAAPDISEFHKYTEIENIQRFPDAFNIGEEVIITEKLHGTNCRLGRILHAGEYIFCAGSHNVRLKEWPNLYWSFLTENVKQFLVDLSNEWPGFNVIVFGEIFGPGIQDLDYGLGKPGFRAFDISIDGVYLDYFDFYNYCERYGIKTVPILVEGAFRPQLVEEYTYGDTMFENPKSKFKGREGCVIRPALERHSDVLNGRLILKSISADYRDRKGAVDNVLY